MNLIPQQGRAPDAFSSTFAPANAIAEVADFLGDPVMPADFPETILRFRNDRAADSVGLAALNDTDWIQHFGRFVPLPGSLPQPLALRYHGHQFRNYNPEIGDGRGFLFAQLRDDQGRLLDLGTKGSGQTPWSRFGDGRLTLKGAVREILATEMLEALGVETSRTFSIIETGEALHRGDEPSPTRSAVLVRLNHSHMRIGSFQRLATLGLKEELARLVDYALRHYFGEEGGSDAAPRLLGHVVGRTARLAAQFMTAGFVHGVLNSDNINLTGESFDFGPWRFAPVFDPGFTAAYFDERGLYAYGRQPEAIHWDVAQLAVSLLSLADEDALVEQLNGFGDAYAKAVGGETCKRLGITPRDPAEDHLLANRWQQALVDSRVPLDQAWYDWRGGAVRQGAEPGRYAGEGFDAVRALLAPYERAAADTHPYWQAGTPCAMLIEEVEAIWAPIAADDDWRMLHAKVAAIRAMGAAMRAS